jgi:hypothetical protein
VEHGREMQRRCDVYLAPRPLRAAGVESLIEAVADHGTRGHIQFALVSDFQATAMWS